MGMGAQSGQEVDVEVETRTEVQAPVDGVGAAARVWLGFAAVAAVAAVFTISQATLGVGLVCLACFLAILGRIWQAAKNHKELMEKLDRR